MQIKWLIPEAEKSNCDEPLYSLDKIKSQFKVEKLDCLEDAYIVLNESDEFWLKFAILDFASSDVDGSNTCLGMVFHGEGPTGSLRECRHTYWGEDGYIFYLKKELINAALNKISIYFDLN